MLTGCSAEWHLKKAVKKNPSLIQPSVHTIDTIIIRDSFEFSDTFVTKTTDTITIEKEGVKTIVYRDHDIIKVRTIVKPDTIRIQKTIRVPRVMYHERIAIPQKIGVGIGFILLLMLLLALFKRWAIGTTPTTRTIHKTDGKHHHGVPHKAVEHERVCAKTKTLIQKNVVMAHCGRKELAPSTQPLTITLKIVL